MTRSPERGPRMPDVGVFLARVLRAVASVLEGRRARRSVPDEPLEAEMAILRRRYPDAPEHWLRFVAERMPASTTAGETRGEEADARRPADRGASPPSTRSGGGRVALFGRRKVEASEETAAARQDAAAKRNPDDARFVSSSSSRTGEGRTAEPGICLPGRPPLQPNSNVSFPRFRSQPAAERPPTAPIEPIPAPATNHRRFVARFVFSDNAPGFDSPGDAALPDKAPVRRLGLRFQLPVTRRPVPKPSAPGERRRVLHPRRTPGELAFTAPAADQRNDADMSRGTAGRHAASEKRPGGQRDPFGRLAAPRDAEPARNAVLAPDEPKWPELPESSLISPDSERVPSARVSSVSEECDRWNGLPF